MPNQRVHLIISGLDEVRGVLDASVLGQGLACREDSAARNPLGPLIAEERSLVAQPVHGACLSEQLVEGVAVWLRHSGPNLGSTLRECTVRTPNTYAFDGATDRVEQDLRHLQRVGLANVLTVNDSVADEFEVGRECRGDLVGQSSQGVEHLSGRIERGNQSACSRIAANGLHQAFELVGRSPGDRRGTLQEALKFRWGASGPFLGVYKEVADRHKRRHVVEVVHVELVLEVFPAPVQVRR